MVAQPGFVGPGQKLQRPVFSRRGSNKRSDAIHTVNILTASISDENLHSKHTFQHVKQLGVTRRKIPGGKINRSSVLRGEKSSEMIAIFEY